MKHLTCLTVLLSISIPLRLQAQASRALPLRYVGPATRADISAGDLMTRLYAYADDSMMGRDGASEFNALGTAYIAAELRRLGLEPAGDDGYFQYPLVNRAVDSVRSTLSVDGRAFALWRDFAPRDQGTRARAFDGLGVVYGGSLGDTARMIPRGSAAGRVVLVTLGRDSTGHRDHNAVNRFQITQRFREAAAILIAELDHLPPGYVQQNYMQQGLGVRGQVSATELPSYAYVSDAVVGALFATDPETSGPGTVGRAVRGTFPYAETRGAGRNVVALLRGRDPALRGQYVVIGAHNDHVGFTQGGGRMVDHDSVRLSNRIARRQGVEQQSRPLTPEEQQRFRAALDSAHAAHGGVRNDSIFNGADDDGSGTVGLLEIAERFARDRTRPRRSVLFVWHVAEEYGMLGSRYFTDHPTVPRDSLVAQLNIDMIGRGGAADVTGVTSTGSLIEGGPGYLQLIGSRRLSTELGDLVERVNTEGRFGMRFDYALDANGHPQNIYCRSDHAMYARWGIPVVFFTTGGHSDYHQVSDEPQYIDYQRLERVTSLIAAVATRVANLDHRVVVDHPKPDPTANCQQ